MDWGEIKFLDRSIDYGQLETWLINKFPYTLDPTTAEIIANIKKLQDRQ